MFPRGGVEFKRATATQRNPTHRGSILEGSTKSSSNLAAFNFSKKLLAAPVTTRATQKKAFIFGSNVSETNSLFDEEDSMNMSTDSPAAAGNKK